ncbi:MAG: SUMF1/EgtB/PvdO family nonheme iron enzyme [Pyrinomonadaceae bacterium]
MKECPACHRCFTDDFSHCPTDGDTLAQTLVGEPILDGRYQLESRLGHGGMGIVFKARHIFLKTSHAIKVVLPDLVGNDPSLVTRFRQEAMAAAAIRHPNIIAVTDFGVTRGTMPFLVMEFIKGKSLHDVLGEQGRLSLQQTFEIIAAVGAGVGAAHHQGIVHRDLKPLNIMLVDGQPMSAAVKVLDFGLAKIKSGELLGSFVQAQTTGLMGSPYYMAPEQWSDEEPDRRADIYSLGIIIFQMLVGDVPFKGASMPSIMKKHLTSPPPPLTAFGVNVSPAVERVINQALEKSPDARPQTVDELIVALRQAIGSSQPGYPAAIDPLATNVMYPVPQLTGDHLGKTAGRSPAGDATKHEPRQTAYIAPPTPEQTPGPGGGLATNVPAGDATANTEALNQGETGVIDPHRGGGGRDPGSKTTASTTPGQAAATSYGNAPPAKPPPKFDATNQQDRGVFAETAGKFAGSEEPAPWETRRAAAAFEPSPPAIDAAIAPPRPAASNLPAVILASIFGALILLGGLGFAVYRFVINPQPIIDNSNTIIYQQTPAPTVTEVPQPPIKTAPEMIVIPGGTFQMGTNDVAANSTVTFDVVQWPAHPVSVKSFRLQKTEVTNAAYAEFIKATGHTPPEDWAAGVPPASQELWPVRFISYDDAGAYAAWISQQGSVKYRLPTEEEWEYAARDGGRAKLYPWGDEWVDGRANVDAGGPKIVNSYPQGANRWGVVDLIGNVSEWTASKASIYGQHPAHACTSRAKGHLIQRGGSYLSKPKGDRAITALRRAWNPSSMKNPSFGFRLASDGP